MNLKFGNFIASLLLTACNLAPLSNHSPKSSEKALSTLRLHMSNEPLQLDPRLASDATSGNVLRMIYEGLTRLDHSGNPVGALAERIECKGDTELKFTLREATWSNGDPITSEHFYRTWCSILDPKFKCENAYHLFLIKNAREIKAGNLPMSSLQVECPDSRTLIVHLENPTPYFLEVLAFDSFYPFHPETRFPQGSGAIPSITCGPFQLKSWRLKNELNLVKNERYWDRDNVHFDRVHIDIIADDHAPLYLFERGDLDFVGAPLSPLPFEDLAAYSSKGQLSCVHSSFAYWYMLNTREKPFTNLKVRRAFAQAINRHALTCVLEGGLKPSYWFLPPSLNSGNLPLIRDEGTLNSKKLLEEGLTELGISQDEGCEITLIYNNIPLHKRIAQVVQQQWQQTLGVKVNLVTMEGAEYSRRLKRKNFQVARYGWLAQFNDPINFLEIFTSPQVISGYNFSNWENFQYDELVKSIRQTGDVEERRRLVASAEALLMAEMPVIPVFFHSFCHLKSPKLKRVVFTPNGKIDFRWAYFQDHQKPHHEEES